MQLKPFDECSGIAIDADVRRSGDILTFTYQISGELGDIVIPPKRSNVRTDGLWQVTCFEAFISVGGTRYAELNFSPSGEWAAYRFTNYRGGMLNFDIAAPEIGFASGELSASAQLPAEPDAPLNLTAVLEHKSGIRTYWALAHPGGNRPDFHARDCFVARLP